LHERPIQIRRCPDQIESSTTFRRTKTTGGKLLANAILDKDNRCTRFIPCVRSRSLRGSPQIRQAQSATVGSFSQRPPSKRLEMMNGSEACGPSDGFRAPSPKRRRLRLRVSCSPSPQPSPQGEGETFARALIIRPSLVVVCLRTEKHRSGDCNHNARTFQRDASALPLLGGEGWGEGEGSKLQPQANDDSRNY
jgi:hypothetical protein